MERGLCAYTAEGLQGKIAPQKVNARTLTSRRLLVQGKKQTSGSLITTGAFIPFVFLTIFFPDTKSPWPLVGSTAARGVLWLRLTSLARPSNPSANGALFSVSISASAGTHTLKITGNLHVAQGCDPGTVCACACVYAVPTSEQGAEHSRRRCEGEHVKNYRSNRHREQDHEGKQG